METVKLLKNGIAKNFPADKIAEYKAAGWVEIKPKKEKAKPEKEKAK